MFLRPQTLGEAIAALDRPGLRLLAGGTDFYPALEDRAADMPLLDLTAIGELRGIEIAADHIRIGATATWSELIAAKLPRACDGLKAAAREIGSIQIQNRATLVGNLCNASPAADGMPALIALDAEIELASRAGRRRLKLDRFVTGNRRTDRRADEIATAIILPRDIDGPSVFLKLGARRYLVISIAMVAAILEIAGGKIAKARIAVGACSAVAQRLGALERDLIGQSAAAGIGAAVMSAHLADLAPIDDLRASAAYRRDAAGTLVARALERCVAGETGSSLP